MYTTGLEPDAPVCRWSNWTPCTPSCSDTGGMTGKKKQLFKKTEKRKTLVSGLGYAPSGFREGPPGQTKLIVTKTLQLVWNTAMKRDGAGPASYSLLNLT